LEIDYLLNVDNEARLGALRFTEEAGGPFLAPGGPVRTRPLLELPRLLSATERIAAEVAAAVSTWRQEVSQIGLTSNQIGRMASAFEHDDLKKATGRSVTPLAPERPVIACERSGIDPRSAEAS
jgi:hypothetical protein